MYDRLKFKFKKGKNQTRKERDSVNEIPGQATYVGEKTDTPLNVEILNFNREEYEHHNTDKIEGAFHLDHPEDVSWINVTGLQQTEKIERLGKHYNLHPLIIEDIVNTEQRPKIDEYENYLFIVLKMLYFKDNELVFEHVSLILGENYVLSFQENQGDVFQPLRKRILNAKGRVRNLAADYLLYSLIDAVIDNYFEVIEKIGLATEGIEDQLFIEKEDDNITQQIQALKHEILRVRRSIYPLREVINRLEKNEHSLIREKTQNYLRDLYDHIIQVSENIEIYREMIWGLMDMYMTTISNKMNEVMKVLTIIASIFIPLTFLAGIYGMNFEYMPELKLRYGYYYFWGLLILIFIGTVWYFKHKRWL